MTYQIETSRLILRPPLLEDFDAWAAMGADEELTRFVGGPQPRSISWRTLAGQAGCWALLGYGLFSVIDKSTGRWAGCVGPVRPPGWPGNEVGWRLARWALGRGFATEAASAAILWVVREHDWSQIMHPIHPDNRASIRVAERLGAHRGGSIAMPAPFDTLPMVEWSYGPVQMAKWRERSRLTIESRPVS